MEVYVMESGALDSRPDAATLCRHYISMVRKHLMDDSKLAELARSIYSRHKVALDYIFEQLPDRQLKIGEIFKNFVGQHPAL